MALTETWLKSHKDAEVSVDGFQIFRADRKRKKKGSRGRLSGGVAAYVNDDLASHMKSTSITQMVLLKFLVFTRKLKTCSLLLFIANQMLLLVEIAPLKLNLNLLLTNFLKSCLRSGILNQT